MAIRKQRPCRCGQTKYVYVFIASFSFGFFPNPIFATTGQTCEAAGSAAVLAAQAKKGKLEDDRTIEPKAHGI